jgi:hypothetical protein
MSSRSAHANELGAFLKARRAELTPRDVGLQEGGTPRRVRGCARFEQAARRKPESITTRQLEGEG